MSIHFEQITKRYGAGPVVNDVSLQIEAGEFFVLLGPSGSGKSTLLRIAAGLADVDHGRISFSGRDVTHVRARERGVGLVFQHYALFRHMTVGENVEFALRVRGVKRRDRARRRDELLQLVALEGYAARLPGQLSGGQQQRVAVARALAHEPQVLLLDEPFGALDAKIRVELRETIRQVQRRLGMTTILVTHDQEEAFVLADRIGVMHHGRLLETGRAETLYRRPATRFVATFLGAANLLLGARGPDGLRLGRKFLAGGESLKAEGDGDEVITVVRPEDIEVAEEEPRLRSGTLATGHVVAVDFGGVLERVRVQLGPESAVLSAVERESAPGAATAAAVAEPIFVDVTRTNFDQSQLPLTPGKRVALGIRRFHLLPTPISSFRILDTDPQGAARMRASPLMRALLQSMQAPVQGPGDARETDAAQTGVGVMSLDSAAIARITAAVLQGRHRLLCIPPQLSSPRRLVIYCSSDAARAATLGLVASVMRHLNAEATFVSVQSPTAPRTEVTSSFRRLLDARAELQESHGLDIRTDVQIGDLNGWVAQLAGAEEPMLVVLGLDGTAAQLETLLRAQFQPLFSDRSRCALLLSCTGAPARADAGTGGADALFEVRPGAETAPATLQENFR
jgi:ABC-type Fe3+/spermidine/putrescine transport system ATPase subunit